MSIGEEIQKYFRTTERAIVIKEVLEIIDKYTERRFFPDGSIEDSIVDMENFLDAVQALKGGEE